MCSDIKAKIRHNEKCYDQYDNQTNVFEKSVLVKNMLLVLSNKMNR